MEVINPRVMYGVVDQNGKILSGKGFLVEKVDRGIYTIVFETEYVYNALPGVSAT